MSRLQGDINIIQAELHFLRTQYEQAFRQKDLRKLKGLSLWINKLEKKLESALQRSQKKNTDYLWEYKSRKKVNGSVALKTSSNAS